MSSAMPSRPRTLRPCSPGCSKPAACGAPALRSLAAEREQEGDVALEHVGKEAAMPWETDASAAHGSSRVTTEGNVPLEGHILDWIDEKIHALDDFGDTNWRQRTVVEIAAPSRSAGVVPPCDDGQEWLLRLVFLVQETFKQGSGRAPGHKPLNEMEGLQVTATSSVCGSRRTRDRGPR